jgi:dTDP-4-amino-4,6-dideoxygalactose transaminase
MSDAPFLPFALPDIGEEEIAEVVDALRSGWITTGPKTKKFEEAFADFIGCRHALAVNSATAGLHLALDAIGLGRGDKVITTPYTFTATAEVIRYFDADPIFSDIDPRTFNLDVDALEQTIENAIAEHGTRVKAIIPVHIAGQSCQMGRIRDLAARHGLKVIEDAAHALPTTYDGQLVGTLSDLTVFSFYATKTIATGEGGMVVTNDDDMAKRIKMMRLHGFNRDAWDRYNSPKAAWYYEILAPGFKYNLTDLASALGLHQLAKARRFHAQRKAIAERYDAAFHGVDGLGIPHVERPQDDHAWHLYMLKVPKGHRDAFFEEMRLRGVGCSVHFIPLHLHPFWRERYGLKPQDFPAATSAFESELSLPIYTRMNDGDVERVISAVLEVHQKLSAAGVPA